MSAKPAKKHSKQPRMSRIHQKALELVKNDPALTDYKINQQLMAMGETKTHDFLYRKTPKNRLIRSDLDKVREAHEQQLTYDMMPKAFDNARKVFKSKDIDEEKKFPYTKLMFDKYFGEKERTWTPGSINLTEVQAIVNQTINVGPQDVVIEGETVSNE